VIVKNRRTAVVDDAAVSMHQQVEPRYIARQSVVDVFESGEWGWIVGSKMLKAFAPKPAPSGNMAE
jgi:hypothetical protein